MPKTVHTVTMPDQTTARRVSENRVYPFAVVGQRCRDAAMRAAKVKRGHVAHFGYLSNSASVQPGETYPEPGYRFPVTQAAHDQGVAMLAATPTVEAYVEAEIAKATAAVEAQIADGYFDQWHALTWASRRDLAEKQLGAWPNHTNVQVLETVRTAQQPRKAA